MSSFLDHLKRQLQMSFYAFDNVWNENDHPRDEQGRFIAVLPTVEITNEHLKDLPDNLTDTASLKEFLLEKLRDIEVINDNSGATIGFF